MGEMEHGTVTAAGRKQKFVSQCGKPPISSPAVGACLAKFYGIRGREGRGRAPGAGGCGADG